MVQTETQIFSSKRFHYADVLLTLAAILAVPVYLYGVRVLWLAATALITAALAEYVCDRLAGQKRIPKGDASWAVTALIVVMLVPATAPLWIIIWCVLFGLCIAKHPFGGTGRNIFNPAAAGVAFCTLCWPEIMQKYPIPFTTQGSDPSLIQYGVSPASVLKVGGTPRINFLDILLGQYCGPLGTTCMIVLAACFLFLLFRRRISPWTVFSAAGVIFLWAIFFPRVITGWIASTVYEFSSGALAFGLVFLVNDPATMPKTKSGQLFYGILIGFITILMRRFGAMELEFVFVILLANVFASSCDRYAQHLGEKFTRLSEKARLARFNSGKAGKKDA